MNYTKFSLLMLLATTSIFSSNQAFSPTSAGITDPLSNITFTVNQQQSALQSLQQTSNAHNTKIAQLEQGLNTATSLNQGTQSTVNNILNDLNKLKGQIGSVKPNIFTRSGNRTLRLGALVLTISFLAAYAEAERTYQNAHKEAKANGNENPDINFSEIWGQKIVGQLYLLKNGTVSFFSNLFFNMSKNRTTQTNQPSAQSK